MSPLHEAVEGFDRAAEAYERGRPDYPRSAIDLLATRLPIRPGARVVELASGTGKLTRALQSTGADLLAVEPTRGMRVVLARVLPALPVLAATAEALPLTDACADVVVVGQAFHWFRAEAALGEIARVLRPGGALALLWNRRDASVPWMARLGELLREHEAKEVPKGRAHAWKPSLAADPRFTPLESAELPHTPRSTPDAFVDRILSVSYVALLPDGEKARLVEEVRALLADEPTIAGRAEFPVPYRTELFWTRRR